MGTQMGKKRAVGSFFEYFCSFMQSLPDNQDSIDQKINTFYRSISTFFLFEIVNLCQLFHLSSPQCFIIHVHLYPNHIFAGK